MHDDTPCATWKIGVVEALITGGVKIVQTATLHTAIGLTNQPIAKVYHWSLM